MTPPSPDASYATYTPAVLRLYDAWVLGLSNRWAWRCPTKDLVAHYDRHVGACHLDVGPGTGYFLDRCRFPVAHPSITLLDANPHCLERSARRIARYAPRVRRADLLDAEADWGGPYDSVALGYVLHCLPGPLERKAAVLGRAASALGPRGVLFGSTILGRGVPTSRLARRLMKAYNARGIFDNETDDEAGLAEALARGFDAVEITVRGTVALFAARFGARRTKETPV